MLKETHVDPFKSVPISLQLLDLEEYPFHIHGELEVLYVLRGELEITVSVYNMNISENNFFIVNADTLHYLKKASSNTIVLSMHVSLDHFKAYYPNIHESIFICSSMQPTDHPEAYDEMRKIILEIAQLYFVENNEKTAQIYELCISLLLILQNSFRNWYIANPGDPSSQLISSNIYKDKAFQIQRLHNIIGYIYDNSAKKITLNDLAKEENISKYYVSHLVASGIGTNFQDFLNGIRVEKSIIDLLSGLTPIEEVSEKVGFSSVAYYRKVFSSRVGHTPSRYRKLFFKKTLTNMTPLLKQVEEDKAKLILESYRGNQDKASNKSQKEIGHFSIDLSSPPTSQKLSYNLRIFIPSKSEFFNCDLFDRIIKLKEALRTDFLAMTADLLEEQFFRNGNWHNINLFIQGLKSVDLGLEIIGSPKDYTVLSLVKHLSDLPQVKYIITEAENFTLCDTQKEILEAVHHQANIIHSGINIFFNEIGLKLHNFYVHEFIQKSFGRIVGKEYEYILTSGKKATNILIANESQAEKDYILNLSGINNPLFCHVYYLPHDVDSRSNFWLEKKGQIKLSPEMKKLCESEISPKSKISLIPVSHEYDLFIPLNANGLALVVLNDTVSLDKPC